MARGRRLSCLEKRNLLNRSAVSVAELVEWGKRYEEMELVHDALDFYERANAEEDLCRLLGRALDDGDYFLLKRVCTVLKRHPSEQELLKVAERGEQLGKERFAQQAREQLDSAGTRGK